MIQLRESTFADIPTFVAFESASDTSDFIIPYSAERHRLEMENELITYLSIYDDQVLAGFIILAVHDNDDIEFRRIVVGKKGQGIGQSAVTLMEGYCASQFGGKRVWLDVFAENERGQHIYQKLGYKIFKTGDFQSKRLLFMEKTLAV
ncbi:N-acetyltransferase [Vibrio sp. T187]|uniref:GNAT family N-acetyltransferase n=1 Tax=Vibrio TaxID=662 RepID=UPI0010CA01E9|nr:MULTISPECIES: N-acetyltransferase [Vibrio]MBW3695316.1 N-acetyltransferase [Vibrio sp. T187]